ncbi:MAG: hypothetical protein GQ583_04805 [Methyloprofundus sp.]|nr:hypothetical protein [Methyloprofundus sp.]
MVSKNIKSESYFVTYLSVKNNEYLNKALIDPLVDNFFRERKIVNYQSIIENADISDLDYSKKDKFFEYLYSYIFNDIYKKDGKVEVVTKYCITLDKENCPQKCEKTEIFYDEFLLYDQPVFYFIYLDIQDIFNFLRK